MFLTVRADKRLTRCGGVCRVLLPIVGFYGLLLAFRWGCFVVSLPRNYTENGSVLCLILYSAWNRERFDSHLWE